MAVCIASPAGSAEQINGRVAAPPSKSAAHRALICAALAGEGTVRGIIRSEDMLATLDAIRALGVSAEHCGDTVHIYPGVAPQSPATVNCRESGTTLRLIMPVLAARGVSCMITGQGRLPDRPLGVFANCLPGGGIALSSDRLPLYMDGTLGAGTYRLPGNISSQFISGLLLALPLCASDSRIELTTSLESAAYVTMTTDMMSRYGVHTVKYSGGWDIPGGQKYAVRETEVEGDWSQAAFLLVMGAVGGQMELTRADTSSGQGDREIVDILACMGADITVLDHKILCRKSRLRGVDIDAAGIPDLVPVLAVAAALAEGVTVISGAARLRLKESDRLAAVTQLLNSLGADITELDNGLRIRGVERLAGGKADGCGDHRIVMSAAVAALGCRGPVEITGCEAVTKSWPEFFKVYNDCGGDAHVL